MRIVAGAFRGRTLVAPRGATTRPTSDRVREALFSIIGPVEGMTVLDLFAGSGALGFEALSRGASSVTFVDSSRAAAAAVRTNSAMAPEPDRVRLVVADWRTALQAEAAAGRKYELCLIDPPYSVLPRIAVELGQAVVPVLENGATLVVESAATSGPVAFEELDVTARRDRTYGGTRIAVMRIGGTE